MAPISVPSVQPPLTDNNASLSYPLTDASSGPSPSVTYHSATSTAATTYGGVASRAPESVHEFINNVLTTKFVEVTPTATETPVSASTALEMIEASPTHVGMDGQPVTVTEATKAVKKHHSNGGAFRIARPQDPATRWFAIISVCLVSGLALGGVICCVIECRDRSYEREEEKLEEQVKKLS